MAQRTVRVAHRTVRVAIAVAATLCAPGLAAQAPAAKPSLPAPSLDGMQEGPRRRVELLRARLDELAVGGAPAAERAETAGDLGRHYLAYELFDAAEAAFRAAAITNAQDPRWPYYLGVVLETRGDLEGALAAFESARTLAPRDGANLIRLGNLLLELDRAPDARAAFAAALEAEPPALAAAHHGLGKAAALAGDQQEAAEHFERALALDPSAGVIHYALGQAYRKLGDLERARAHLRRRGDVEPAFPDPLGDQVAWIVIGTAFEALQDLASREDFSERDFMGFVQSHFGEIDGAAAELREALRIRGEEARALEPGSPAAVRDRTLRARIHYALAGLLVNRRLDEEAAHHLRTALELEPGLEDCRVRLGNYLARTGDLEGAAAEYTTVLARNPDSTAALLRRGAAWTGLGRSREAIADLERLVALDPRHSEGLLRLGALYAAEGGDAERARRLLHDALALELDRRERVAAHVELGRLEWRLGAPERAIEQYRAALAEAGPGRGEAPEGGASHHGGSEPGAVPAAAEPTVSKARFGLATALGSLARWGEAAAAYRELIDAEPHHEPARLGEATALALAGREREARARLEEGLAALPRSLDLTHALARLLAAAGDPAVRDGARAVELATRAVQALSSLEHAETLAMALAEAGRLDDAVDVQERLVAEADARAEAAAASRLRRHLALYRAGRACCGE